MDRGGQPRPAVLVEGRDLGPPHRPRRSAENSNLQFRKSQVSIAVECPMSRRFPMRVIIKARQGARLIWVYRVRKDVQDPTSRRKVRNKRSSRYGLVSALNPIEKPLGSTERSLKELLKKSRWYCVRDRDQLGDFREHGGAVKKSTMQKNPLRMNLWAMNSVCETAADFHGMCTRSDSEIR